MDTTAGVVASGRPQTNSTKEDLSHDLTKVFRAVENFNPQEWCRVKLLNQLDFVNEKIRANKGNYLEYRSKFVLINLLLTRLNGCMPPIKRCLVKAPPRFGPPDDYPNWASLLSNDRQLIDLDYLLVTFGDSIIVQNDRYADIWRSNRVNHMRLEELVSEVGYVSVKLKILSFPIMYMYLLNVLNTPEIRAIQDQIGKISLRYRGILNFKKESDKRCRLDEDTIGIRVGVLEAINLLRIFGEQVGASKVRLILNLLLGLNLNSTKTWKVCQKVTSDTDLEPSLLCPLDMLKPA
jgi:hypothetical protein